VAEEEARTPEPLPLLEQQESEPWPTAELEQPVEVAQAAVPALDKPVAEAAPDKPVAEVQLAPEPAFAPPTAGNSGSRYMPGELLSRILDKST
jgi:hypothetical protein